jgi:hypothetical protein
MLGQLRRRRLFAEAVVGKLPNQEILLLPEVAVLPRLPVIEDAI